ncbi:hypothetical protein BKA58DRAFT_35881 [Alternaria rosae]|uniref:uncharacterized protein n=1 Tax=Alternaria rosae TaxID=1187941 RepID=UPI001E8EBC6B|nr:uncharacterized protein BKA58DRAFT_35881 [Alternaria rosae]KAH6883387.1 hypothetical protein BKA58DRAFT_35881 [Alternaria rosae]
MRARVQVQASLVAPSPVTTTLAVTLPSCPSLTTRSIFLSGTVGGVHSSSSGDRTVTRGLSWTAMALPGQGQRLRMSFTGRKMVEVVLQVSVGSAPKRLLAYCLFAGAAHHVTSLRMQNICC